MPDSVVVLATLAGLLMGLAALCCCFEGPAVAHGTGRITAVGSAVAPDSVPDMVVAGDPPGQDADGTGDACGHPGDHPAAVVASGGAVTRDLPATAVGDIHRPGFVVTGPSSAVGGTAARAPASHLLCIMRT